MMLRIRLRYLTWKLRALIWLLRRVRGAPRNFEERELPI
jgi:hypothetical protein